MKPRLSIQWLSGCAGCEVVLVDLGEELAELLNYVQLVHMPLLMDSPPEAEEHHLPDAEIGVLTGAIRTAQDLVLARAMRMSCTRLVAVGTCATHGGITAMANAVEEAQLLAHYYQHTITTEPAPVPSEGLAPILERVYAVDEKVEVDLAIPGCPPHPRIIMRALIDLAQGRTPTLPEASVCNFCPAQRSGSRPQQLARGTLPPPQQHTVPVSRCLLELGIVCLGPVTRAGCSANGSGPPRCPKVGVACRGCGGPLPASSNQMLELLAALASGKASVQPLADVPGLMRFSAAHGWVVHPSRR